MKCRYFCRLPLDISPVYLTRGISQYWRLFFWDHWRWDGAFLTWWSAAKEGEGKRKERNGLNYPIYGIIIPETDTQRNMMRAGHGARLRRCRTVISKAWMD